MILRARDVTVRFRRGVMRRPFAALDRVNLEIREGEFFALLGQNGAGKSTAMHCLLGLLRPASGSVEIFGSRPEPGTAFFARVGYLPEEPRYHEYLTIEEAVTYYAKLSGVRAPAARVAAILEQLGLGEHRRLAIRRCSKGMKQKVGIAQCVIHEPRLLFLDEPMRGLDPMTVHLFRDLLVQMNKQGVTVVMNSHLLSEVELVASRVAIIERGRVVADDEVAKLVRRDTGRYAVRIESAAVPPPHLQNVVQANGHTTGTVPVEELYSFMDHARLNGIRVLSCAIEKQTLEESFLAIVRGGRADA